MKKTPVSFNLRYWICLLTVCLVVWLSPPSGNGRAEAETIHYRLKWLYNTSVAGDIYAGAAGFFEEVGLDVTVKQGSPEKNAIKELELGFADFGVASADQVIRALEKGADVVVLAQLFQVNPMQWIYRNQGAAVSSIQALKGRSIGVTYGGNDESILRSLLSSGGLTMRDLKVVGARFDFTPFLKGRVEFWPVYRNSQGVILENKLGLEGEGVRFLNPADFGVRFVANSLVTSARTMERRPELVRRFVTALLKGWEAAMDPAQEAAVLAAVKTLDRGVTDEIRQQQLTATRPLVKPSPAIRIGTIDRQAWIQTETIMAAQGLIRKRVDIQSRLKGPESF